MTKIEALFSYENHFSTKWSKSKLRAAKPSHHHYKINANNFFNML